VGKHGSWQRFRGNPRHSGLFLWCLPISPRSDADIRELEEYIWVNNANDNNLQLVDTRDNQVYGPFLENMIGNSDGTGITVAGDDTFMLITSFHQGLIYHVNIENPFYPQIVSTYNIGWSVEDISLSQDGRYAVISDGGNSTYIGLIDLNPEHMVQTINISPRFAQSIEIGPDGKILVGATIKAWCINTSLISKQELLQIAGSA
jgi:DNA-binding beta-propeller fold protein YncE